MEQAKLKNGKPISEISLTWSKTSLIATLTFMLLLILLHFIKSDLDPSWRMISEYAIGSDGWIMVITFLVWALCFVSLFFAIRSQIKNTGGKIGLISLWVSALGCIIAAIFVTDPVTATSEEQTTSGMLHSIGGTLGLGMPVATILLSWALYKNPNWSAAKKPILWSGVLTVIGFFVSLLSLVVFLSQTNGVFSPNTPVGFPMRFEVLCYCIWLITISKLAISLTTNKTI